MYKIISITDLQGNDKSDSTRQSHPQLLGYFQRLYEFRGLVANGTHPRCCFIWADDTDKMMRTSPVQSMSEWDGKIKIVTMNSVYLFEKVE